MINAWDFPLKSQLWDCTNCRTIHAPTGACKFVNPNIGVYHLEAIGKCDYNLAYFKKIKGLLYMIKTSRKYVQERYATD